MNYGFHVPALYATGGHVTGSYPEPPVGLQRIIRQALRMKPRQAPYVVIASTIYEEQEGKKRQFGGMLSVILLR